MSLDHHESEQMTKFHNLFKWINNFVDFCLVYLKKKVEKDQDERKREHIKKLLRELALNMGGWWGDVFVMQWAGVRNSPAGRI